MNMFASLSLDVCGSSALNDPQKGSMKTLLDEMVVWVNRRKSTKTRGTENKTNPQVRIRPYTGCLSLYPWQHECVDVVFNQVKSD